MAKRNAKKETPKSKWRPFTAEQYNNEIAILAHFSAKTVNSNTPDFGVRIGAKDRIDLPYVAVSTLDPARIQVDYVKNAGTLATMVKQFSAVVEDKLDTFDFPPLSEIEAIKSAADALKERYETPLSLVGMRLRQIIVQDETGEDMALTPLHSAGLSKELERRLAIEDKAAKLENEEKSNTPHAKRRYRERGYMEIGGANPQNVGRHTRSMWNPLCFAAPSEDADARKAFAMHFRGISLVIPNELLAEYYTWREKRKHLGVVLSDMDARDKEKELLVKMTRVVLSRAASATQTLRAHQDKLPGGELTAYTLKPRVMRALLDPTLRDGDWRRDFATELYQAILNSKVRIKGELIPLGVGEDASTRWISIIEEAL